MLPLQEALRSTLQQWAMLDVQMRKEKKPGKVFIFCSAPASSMSNAAGLEGVKYKVMVRL